MSYRKLHIWKLAREVSIDIHHMTLTLPKFELYETGSLKDDKILRTLSSKLNELGKKISVHTKRRKATQHLTSKNQHPVSRTQYLVY